MSDREADEKAPLDDPDAFEARLPPKAFEPIARALNLVATPGGVLIAAADQVSGHISAAMMGGNVVPLRKTSS